MTDQEIAEAPRPDVQRNASTPEDPSAATAPGADAPARDGADGAASPAAPTPGADAPGADAPGADAPGADAPGADAPGGAPGSGGDTRGEIKYDFTRPWTISNKFHRNLESIAEAFANQLGFTMSNYLRTSVDVTFQSVKQVLFHDYLERLPERKCIGVFSIQPLAGQAVITVDGGLMFVVLDKLIGGQGKPHEVGRDFTEIETRIFMLVLNKVLNDLREAARKFFDSTPHLSRIESNPAFIAVMTGGEKVIAITLDMTIGEHAGPVTVAIPMASFDPVMEALDPKDEILVKHAEVSVEEREKILSALHEASVEVTAVLGEARITLDRLLNLEVGDTLILDRAVNEPVAITAGKKTIRRGQPGKSQNRKAVKIV